MAIFNTGHFAPLVSQTPDSDRSSVSRDERTGRVVYKIDLRHQKINEIEYIKWCRRNLGDRHAGWDFWMEIGNQMLYIEVWGEKQKFTYEMWKN